MRAVVAFFGLPRCSAVCWPSIERHLLAPLATAASVKVVAHLYRQDRVVNPRSGEDAPLPEANYRPFEAFRTQIEARPLDEPGLLASLKPYGDAWGDGHVSLVNPLLQWRSLHLATALAAAEAPDVVLFARPDLQYHEPLAPAVIDHAASGAMHLGLPAWEAWGGLNDRFALAGSGVYRAYGSRLLLAPHYCIQTGLPLHSERFLAYAMRFAGAQVRTFDQRASRVRVDGSLAEEDFEGRLSPLVRTGPPGP